MPDIDKDQLYGRYQTHEDKRIALGLKLAHKALDIPQDDMQIQANKTVNGIGTKGVIGTALAAAALPTALAGGMLWNSSRPAPSSPTPAPVPAILPATPLPATPVAPAPQVQDVEQIQQPDGTWKEKWRGPPRPKVSTDKVE